MREFLKRRGLLIAILAVIISVITICSLYFTGNRSSFITNTVNVVLRPVQGGIKGAVGLLEDLYGYLYEFDNLAQENEELKTRVAELESGAREAEEAIEENKQLRELLDFSQKNPDFDLTNVTVTNWTSSNWSSTFTISKGSGDSIQVGDPVITERGALVGQVIETGSSWATVRSIIDTNTNVGAKISGSVGAIATGDFSLMSQGYLKLSYIPTGTELAIGSAIVTSGLGDAFPDGLILGEIIDVKSEDSGSTNYAVIEPAATLHELKNVYVIKDFEIS